MTLETDELADAALRFSEAIRAERTSTFDALAAERQAAIKIIEALRAERGRRAQEAGGRFVFGVALGVAAGIAAIYLVSQRANEEARLGIAAPAFGGDGGGPSLRDRFQRAVEDGKRAARGREDELWQLYRKRLADGQQPPAKADDYLY
jgi:hypothetical protein